MRIEKTVAIVIALVLISGTARAQEPMQENRSATEQNGNQKKVSGAPEKEAPEGFSWVRLEAIGGEILVPDGWHIRARDGDKVDAYFISRESLKEVERFETGLSMNVVYDVTEQTGRSADEFARTHLETALKLDSVEVLASGGDTTGVLHTYIAQFRLPRDDGGKTQVHQVNISDPEADKMYIMIYEAPAEEWEEAWRIGTQMLSAIRLSSE